jgi:ABC-type multidrug transport system ATPase subunit
MISITVSNLGKNFGKEWLFRNLSLNVPQGGRVAILGPNGSGKSTLLQIISGYMVPSAGNISWKLNEQELTHENVFRTLSYAAPYLELTDELTPLEIISFQRINKPFFQHLSNHHLLEIMQLEKFANRPVTLFSSGMKQRLKNGLAILSDVPLLLLDEPCSNFDAAAMEWYQNMIRDFASQKTILVCSNNQNVEFSFCSQAINIQDFV